MKIFSSSATELVWVSDWTKGLPGTATIQFLGHDRKLYETEVDDMELNRHSILGPQYDNRTPFTDIKLANSIKI